MLPPIAPNAKVDFCDGLGDAAGVVLANGLLAPEPVPLPANPPNGDFVEVDETLAGAAPRVLVEPKVELPPPEVGPNLNFRALVVAESEESAGAGDGADDLFALNPNVDAADFGGSGAGVDIEEAPGAGLGAELTGLPENPKLNLGAGGFEDDTAVGLLWGALGVLNAGAALAG